MTRNSLISLGAALGVLLLINNSFGKKIELISDNYTVLERILRVPASVIKVRKRLPPNQVLLDLAPRIGCYLVSDRGGERLRVFAEDYSLAEYLVPNRESNLEHYQPAFALLTYHPGYQRIKKACDARDLNENGVIEEHE